MSSPPGDGGFGPMGGSVGEGYLNDPNHTMNTNHMNMNSNTFGPQQAPYPSAPPPLTPPPNAPPPPPNNNAPYGNIPSTPTPIITDSTRLGSITQYASPDMSTGQQQQQPGMSSPQQQFYQQNPNMPLQQNMQASWQSGNSGYASVNSGGTSPAPGSFAARSAQAYATMGPPQQQTIQQQPSNNMMQSSMMQSYMMQQQPSFQQQQQPPYHQSHPPVQQQQPPQQQPAPPVAPGPQYRSHAMDSSSSPQRPQAPAAPAGSFAARSAQAYASQQQQTGMMQGQGMMQQPNYQHLSQQQQQFQQPGQQFQQPQLQQQFQQPGPEPQYPQQPASQLPASAPQAPQQPTMTSYSMGGASTVVTTQTAASMTPTKPQPSWAETPAQVAIQNRLLTDATRKVQEHAYYMRQAMEKNDLPNVLDRASLMVGQLGENHAPSHHPHGPAGHPGPNAPPPGGEASQLNPKNYYELHMRALEDMPHFEEYLLNISGRGQQQQPVDPSRITITLAPTPSSPADAQFSMRELYDCVQYCPQVLPRLYLQICAGSALIRSGEVGTKWVINDLMQATKCVQNPVRGLFLRHYLLQMVRDKLPDSPAETTPLAGEAAMEASAMGGSSETQPATMMTTANTMTPSVPPEQEPGTVVDSYRFILANFIEMNKLWVRIQHLPGDAKTKDQRKRRERERNELRILVGTNLVRLSQLEGVTSKIYGEIILPTVLDHIVVCGDPLAQAYLIDCITQVFPDEYHIETLPILLRVCPKLRDKVNVRTILQSLMDRLANYLADEELLDETDTNQVKMNMANDSFPMFEECVQNVYNARGPKLGAKEVVRLQTALLSFSLRCFHGDMEQVNRCLQGCVAALKQASASYEMQEGTMAEVPGSMKPLDDVATAELEKLLSIPLDSLALKVLSLPNYGELLAFLPWNHRREVALKLLKAVDDAGTPPKSVKEIEELFGMVEPVIRDENDMSQMMQGMGINNNFAGQQQMGLSMNGLQQTTSKEVQNENALVAKLVHLLNHDHTDVVYEMLMVARQHINKGNKNRTGQTLVAVVFATFRIAQRVYDAENGRQDDGADKSTADAAPASTGEASKEVAEKEDKGESTKADGESGDDDQGVGGGVQGANGDTGAEGQEQTGTETAGVSDEPESTNPPTSGGPKEGALQAQPASCGTKSVSCRKLFVFLQQTIAMLATSNVEIGFKLYLQAALTADRFAGSRKQASRLLDVYGPMPYELISQAFVLFEQGIADSKMQQRCIVCIMGTLLECRSLSDEDYQGLVTKAAQFSAKVLKKSDQCQLVAQCAHLFYPAEHPDLTYRNAQRALECLQRALKLADACTSTNPEDIYLFVDLLDHYLFFFEKKCPVITDAYITGLAALIKEHISNLGGGIGGGSPVINNARDQFLAIVRSIKEKKADPETSEHFAPINVD